MVIFPELNDDDVGVVGQEVDPSGHGVFIHDPVDPESGVRGFFTDVGEKAVGEVPFGRSGRHAPVAVPPQFRERGVAGDAVADNQEFGDRFFPRFRHTAACQQQSCAQSGEPGFLEHNSLVE